MSEARLQQQLDYEGQLKRMLQRIRQSLNAERILYASALELRQLFRADRAIVYRLQPSGRDSQALLYLSIAAADTASSSPLGYPSGLHSAIFWETLNAMGTQNYLMLNDLERSGLPAELYRPWQQGGVHAAAIVVLGDRAGLICLHQCTLSRSWQPYELEGLAHAATEIAIAVEQAELYQQVQLLNAGLEAEVQKRTAQVRKATLFDSTLKRITDKVRDSLDEAQILQTAVRELALVLGLGGCNAALYDLEQETSTIVYEYADALPTYRGRVAQMIDSPKIYQQLQQHIYFQFCSLSPNPQRGHVALLACPIFLDSAVDDEPHQVLGDLWLVHHADHVFNEFEIRLVQQVANQCAIAIRQARLYKAARSQVDELQKLNRMKDEFLSTVSHELRTPMANVKMALRLLELTSLSEQQRKYLDILGAESRREASLIDDLLDMQRLEADAMPLHSKAIHLNSWLVELIAPFQTRVSVQQQTLTMHIVPPSLTVTSDAEILSRILAQLLDNACKYTAAGGQIELICTAKPNAPGGRPAACITVKNQAHIPADELPRIFETFYRIPKADPWGKSGTGLGLALVKKMVARLSGLIEVDSYDGWTSFAVTLPAADPPE
ncbi:MAG: GAF domain-containing protein [Cyanobacteria bacterium P01_A01_bin.135]